MRKRRVIILLGCLAAFLGAAALLLHHPQPTYEGRTLQHWLQAFSPNCIEGENGLEKAREAVANIGTNAIPTLLEWISYEPTPSYRAAADLLSRLPDSIRPDFLTRGRSRAWLAQRGFAILGPAALPATPELARLAITAHGDDRATACITALSVIGPSATPSMLTVVNNRNCRARWYAMLNIAAPGTNARPVVCALLSALDENEGMPTCMAARRLGELRLLPDTVIPALTTNLERNDPAFPEATAAALAEFGPEATFVVPRLLCLMTNKSETVRRAARIALARIAPDTITNTPPN